VKGKVSEAEKSRAGFRTTCHFGKMNGGADALILAGVDFEFGLAFDLNLRNLAPPNLLDSELHERHPQERMATYGCLRTFAGSGFSPSESKLALLDRPRSVHVCPIAHA
jgi:hypothetical protein